MTLVVTTSLGGTIYEDPEFPVILQLVAERGLSAYEIAVQAGFEGTVEEWLASLAVSAGGDFYTEAEIDTLLAGYYTEGEVDTLLAGKSATGHGHDIDDVTGLTTALEGLEPDLGNPSVDGHVLVSTAAGVRSWTALPAAGVTDHGELSGLSDDDHTQYLNEARGDTRYYTKSAVDTLLGGKADTGHTHSYEAPLGNPGIDGYALISTAAGVRSWTALPTVISDHGGLGGLGDDDHTQYHNDSRGDARYYTKSAVDTALSGKAASSHTHAQGDVTGLETALSGKEASLGNPGVDGYLLSSTAAGARSWVAPPSGGASDLNSLSDVVLVDVAPLQMLQFDGTDWTNVNLVLTYEQVARGLIKASHLDNTQSYDLYPDRNMVDDGFYSSPDDADFSFTAIAAPVTYGSRRMNIAGPHTGTRTVVSDWFTVEPSTAYLVRGNATMSSSNDIDVELYFEEGSLDGSGVVTAGTQTLIDSRSNAGNTALAAVNLTTGGSTRRGRFVMKRIDDTGVATAAARFGGLSVTVARPYDISLFIAGKPTDAELVTRIVVAKAFSIPAGAGGSYAGSRVASAASKVFDLLKNGSSFGTITFSTSASGTFSVASQVDFAAGDVLTITAPATADTTLEDISITLAGVRR